MPMGGWVAPWIKLLFASGMNITLNDWSSDDQWIFYSGPAPGDKGWEIWAFNTQTFEAKPTLNGPFNESNAGRVPL